VYIEYELLPFFPGVFELLLLKRRCRVILDYDDAIFHNYDNSKIGVKKLIYKKKISRLMRSASCVIAGNQYIADYARAAGSERVYVLPTVLDLGKYDSAESGVVREKFTIGWIGTPMTVKYLEILRGVLSALYFKDQVRLTLIGCRQFDIPGIEVQTVTWSEETEAQMIRNFDVGVMPLFDGPWERGKCGLKLLQYMACSVPVIASPVGVNVTIVEHGITGFLAHSRREWVEALTVLYEQDKLRLEMGREARYHVSANFDIRSNASILNQILLGTKE
jgi:glycosyltransferase involved in cell wall biosynthesis